MQVMVAHRHTLERRSLSSAARLNRGRRAIDAAGFNAHESERAGYHTDDRGGDPKSLWRQISLILSIAATSLAAVQLPRQARFPVEGSPGFPGATPVELVAASRAESPWSLSQAQVTAHTSTLKTWEALYPNAALFEHLAGRN